MIKHLSKYRSLIAATFILVPLLFWFAYSEIGQYTIEKQHPPAEDYCLVARVIKTEISKTTANNLFKLKVEKSFCMHCVDETSVHNTVLINLEIEHFYPPHKTTPIYLYDRTFLI